MGIVLILVIYKPRWSLSLQSLGSSASQNTVTSGKLHWEIMLCDPGGNGWWRSQHWDVSCLCYFYCIFSLFSLAWLVSFTLCVYGLSMYVGGCAPPQNPVSSLLSLASSPPWSHLLLKPVIHPSFLCSPKPNPKPSPAQPRPRDPCPHHGSWIMYARIQWDEGFTTAPTVTYITPVAPSISCDFPGFAGRCTNMHTHKNCKSCQLTIQFVKCADINAEI